MAKNVDRPVSALATTVSILGVMFTIIGAYDSLRARAHGNQTLLELRAIRERLGIPEPKQPQSPDLKKLFFL